MHVRLTLINRIFWVIAFIAAAGGGAFVGLFSCGGYVWQHSLVISTISVAAIVAGTSSVVVSRSWITTVLLLAGVFAIYRISIAVAWPYYVGPASIGEYVTEFWQALQFGPC
jgi:hypothetical protein